MFLYCHCTERCLGLATRSIFLFNQELSCQQGMASSGSRLLGDGVGKASICYSVSDGVSRAAGPTFGSAFPTGARDPYFGQPRGLLGAGGTAPWPAGSWWDSPMASWELVVASVQ